LFSVQGPDPEKGYVMFACSFECAERLVFHHLSQYFLTMLDRDDPNGELAFGPATYTH
jgi:hypothetical protein